MLDGVNVGGLGADLDFGRTISFEFGVRQAVNDDMVIDVAVYSRDNLALASARTFLIDDPVRQRKSTLVRVTNADFGTTRGVDVRLDRRFGNWFNGTIGYTLSECQEHRLGPAGDPGQGRVAVIELGGIVSPPPQAIMPTGVSRPHDLSATFAFTAPPAGERSGALGRILGSVGLFVTARVSSGTPYTPCTVPTASGECLHLGSPNSVRLPASKQFDLRLTKSFGLGRLAITGYLDVRNLFNFVNVLQVFSETGETANPADRQTQWAADSASFAEDARASRVYGLAGRPAGSIDLRFGEAVASGCRRWRTAGDRPSAPDCVYLIRAEERFGDGDHIFTVAEQRRASDAFYAVERGAHNFLGDPRRMRLGVEVTF